MTVPQVTLQNKSDVAFNWNSYYKVATPTVGCAGSETLRRECSHGGERRVVDLPSYPNCNGLSMRDSLDALYWRCDVVSGHAVFTSIKLKEGKGLKNLISPSGVWKYLHATLYSSGIPVGATASAQWWTNTILPLPLNDGTGSVSLNTTNVIYYINSDQNTSGYYVAAGGIGFVSLNSATLRYSAASPENCQNSFGNPGTDNKSIFCTNAQNFNWYEMNMQTTNSLGEVSVTNYMSQL